MPLLMIIAPTLGYILDRRSGEVPTKAEWQSAAHSSGPWNHTGAGDTVLAVLVAGLLFALVCCGVTVFSGRAARFAAVQFVGVLASLLIVFILFGWLWE